MQIHDWVNPKPMTGRQRSDPSLWNYYDCVSVWSRFTSYEFASAIMLHVCFPASPHTQLPAHKYLNAMKTCHQHALRQYTQRGHAYIEVQTDTNSLLHLNANAVWKATVMLTCMRIYFLTVVFSACGGLRGFTWRRVFVFTFMMIDAAAHSSQPCVFHTATKIVSSC